MAARSTYGSLQKSVRSTTLNAKGMRLRPAEKVTALSIMYQAERQDKANNILASLALIAAALAYLGIAALLLSDEKLPGRSWTPAFLAFPLWVAASFEVLLMWGSLAISQSAQTVERRLVSLLGFDNETRSAGQTFNVYEQPTVLKIQSLICYGGIWSVVLFFSIVCLAVAASSAGWVSAPVIIAGTAYTLFFAGGVAAWLYISRLARETAVN